MNLSIDFLLLFTYISLLHFKGLKTLIILSYFQASFCFPSMRKHINFICNLDTLQ